MMILQCVLRWESSFLNQLGEKMMMMRQPFFSPPKLKSFKEAIDVLENVVSSYLEHHGHIKEAI